MPSLKTYDLFISHAWSYDQHYYGVVRFLDDANNFHYRNYSAPEHKPVIAPGTRARDKRVRDALYNKIRPVNCVLVIAAMYVSHREWIQAELDLASELDKPVIGIAPLGQINLPEPVSRIANEVVRWRQDSIIDAIRYWSI
ncbi:MAG TPA: TIR domain-containing protein [Rhodocyclaceae bacterium]